MASFDEIDVETYIEEFVNSIDQENEFEVATHIEKFVHHSEAYLGEVAFYV